MLDHSQRPPPPRYSTDRPTVDPRTRIAGSTEPQNEPRPREDGGVKPGIRMTHRAGPGCDVRLD